jgi:MFS family permease
MSAGTDSDSLEEDSVHGELQNNDDGVWRSGSRPTPALTRVFVLMGVNIFGNGLVMAFTLIYLNERRGIDLRTAGLILGAMGLTGIASGPIFGTLGDRFGAHRILGFGFLVGAIGYTALAFSTTVLAATASAMICGASFGWGAMNAIVTNLSSKETRPRAFAIQRSVINASIGLGGLVGGLIANAQRPRTFDLLFGLDVITFVIAAVMVFRLPRLVPMAALRPSGQQTSTGIASDSYRTVFRDRAFVRLLPYDFATGFTFAIAFDVLPAAVRKLHVSNGWIGALFGINTAAVVVMQLPTVRAISGRRRMPLLGSQFALFALGFLVTLVAGSFSGISVVVCFGLAMVIFAAGECLMGAVRSPMIADFATPSLIGRYGAITTMMFQLGMAGGRPVGTRALAGSPGTLWTVGIVGSLIALTYILSVERKLPTAVRFAAQSL